MAEFDPPRAPTSWPPPEITKWLTPGVTANVDELVSELEAWTRYLGTTPVFGLLQSVSIGLVAEDEAAAFALNIPLEEYLRRERDAGSRWDDMGCYLEREVL